jgi:hypothetical protein
LKQTSSDSSKKESGILSMFFTQWSLFSPICVKKAHSAKIIFLYKTTKCSLHAYCTF